MTCFHSVPNDCIPVKHPSELTYIDDPAEELSAPHPLLCWTVPPPVSELVLALCDCRTRSTGDGSDHALVIPRQASLLLPQVADGIQRVARVAASHPIRAKFV